MLTARATSATIRAFVIVALVATAAQAQVITRSGTLGGGALFDSPDFGISPPPSSKFGSPSFYFDAFPFTVAASGAYRFNATGSFDPALFLYAGSFNPAAPLTNLLFGASSVPFFGNPGLPLNLPLTSATSYVLVTSSFDVMATGSFTSTISAVATVPEPSTVVLTAAGLALLGAARRRRARLH